VVFVAVAAGISEFEQLADAVRAGPLARELHFPYHPHVTVAHDVPTPSLDFVYEGLTDYEARFDVECFTMFEQDMDGVWQSQREFRLRGGA
jgi:2'-5' RNA ligase